MRNEQSLRCRGSSCSSSPPCLALPGTRVEKAEGPFAGSPQNRVLMQVYTGSGAAVFHLTTAIFQFMTDGLRPGAREPQDDGPGSRGCAVELCGGSPAGRIGSEPDDPAGRSRSGGAAQPGFADPG